MNKNQALQEAWKKIQEYVKTNYTETFENGIEFEWKHEVFGWTKFGVTENGDAYIVTGSHGCGKDMMDFFYHPNTALRTCNPKKLQVTEEVVRDWKKIKEILEYKTEEERNIYNFEV